MRLFAEEMEGGKILICTDKNDNSLECKLYVLESEITIPNIPSTWQDPTTSRADDIENAMRNFINNGLVPSGQMKNVCTYIQELEE